MMNKTWLTLSTACALLITGALLAQDNPPQSANMDLTGLPNGHGVYYRSAGGWVSLSSNVLMPFWEGRDAALEILNVGSDHTISEIPGPHSGFQISDARPTFYLHGVSPADLYLVRATPKEDYREVRMKVNRHFRRWARFRDEDIAEVVITGVNGDVVAVQPTAALKPGEYALAATFQPDQYWLRLGFDFGVLGQ
jgi:hypothetical protein